MANTAKRVTSIVKREQRSIKPANYNSDVRTQEQIPSTSLLMTRAQQKPERLAPTHTLQLQRTIGNRAVSRLLPQAAQPTLLQTKSDVADYLEKMKEAIKQQQELLDKIKSSEGGKGDQKNGDSGTSQASGAGEQTASSTSSAAVSTAGTGGRRLKWQSGDLDEPKPAFKPPRHHPGKMPPGRPFRPLKHLLKQMGLGPRIKPGKRPPGFPPKPFGHLPEEMRFGFGIKPGRPFDKKLPGKPRKRLKKLGKPM